MAGGKVSTAQKPVMRGLLQRKIKINLVTAVILAAVATVSVRTFYGDARKKKYAEFYKTYDPEASFERMRKAGLLQSVSAD